MKRIVIALAAATALSACGGSRPGLERKVAQLEAVSAQKDSLIQEVLATTQFVGDLTEDLAAVKALNAGKPMAAEVRELEGKSPAEMRAAVRERVRDLATRFGETESRLSQSRARVASLSGANAEMQAQLAVYDSTISSLRIVIESQKTEITALSEQVLGLQQNNLALAASRDTLATQKEQLVGTVSTMATEANKAYYVIGSEKDLITRDILTRTGGFLGFGKTLAPARSLSEHDFTEIDRMRDSTIAFPNGDRRYVIVSRQNPVFLAVVPDKHNELRTGLRVASPEQFWAASKFLIVVEKK